MTMVFYSLPPKMKIPWFKKFNAERWELVRDTQVSLSFLKILEDKQVLTKSEVEEIKYLKVC